MNRRWGILVLGVLALSGCAAREPAFALHTPQTVFRASPGYRFAALPEPDTSVIWLDVRYPVGFADDPADKPGLAHLVEHLLFDVEIDRNGHKSSIDAELRRLTLAYNADTTDDVTTYHTMLQSDRLDEVLRLERERLEVGCTGLTAEIFAHERAVVMREMQTTSTPDALKIEQVVRKVAYPEGHPYRSSSTPESIGKLELADACRFLAGPYQRGEVLVVASGGVDRVRLAHAAHAFDRVPARAMRDQPGIELASLRAQATYDQTQLHTPRLIAMWALPPRDSFAYRMVSLVSSALPEMINRRYPGYGAGVSVVGGAQAPVLVLSLTLHAENESTAAMDAVREAVGRLVRGLGSLKAEAPVWQRVSRLQAASVLSDWDVLSRRNAVFADYLAAGRGTDYLGDRMHELYSAVPAQAAGPVGGLLAAERTRFLLLESSSGAHPEGDPAPELPSDAFAKPEVVDFHEARIDPATADHPLPIPNAPPMHRAETLRLTNGLTVVLWPHGGTPLIRGALVVNAGWVNDPLGREGLARMIGRYQDALVTPDHVLRGGAPELVSQASTLIDELESTLRGTVAVSLEDKQRVRKRLTRDQAVANLERARRVALYGAKHAYARAAITPDTLTMIDSQALTAWTDQHLVAGNATLILTGKFDVEAVKKQLAASAAVRSTGTYDGARSAVDQAHPTQAWLAGRVATEDPSLALEVSFVGGRGIDQDHAKRLVLAEVLSEKLLELRERTALTYVTNASYTPRRGGGQWSLSMVVDRKRAQEAGTALAQLLDQLRRDPEAYRAAFVVARQRVLERLLAHEGSSAQALDALIELVRFDLDSERHGRIAGDVAALTLTNFHAFAAREFAEAGQVFTAIGNPAGVNAALTAAKQATQPASPPSAPTVGEN
jgi:zinc protease